MKNVMFEYEGETYFVAYYTQGPDIRIADIYKPQMVPASSGHMQSNGISLAFPSLMRLDRHNLSYDFEVAFKKKYTPFYVAKEITK